MIISNIQTFTSTKAEKVQWIGDTKEETLVDDVVVEDGGFTSFEAAYVCVLADKKATFVDMIQESKFKIK